MLIKKEGFLLTVVFPLGNDHSFHTKLFANSRKTTGPGVVIYRTGEGAFVHSEFRDDRMGDAEGIHIRGKRGGKGVLIKVYVISHPSAMRQLHRGIKII